MKKGFLAVVALLSIQCAIGQDQAAVAAKQNRLKTMTDFIVRNKACLSGTECSTRFSLFLNYMLGTAFGLVGILATEKVATEVGRPIAKIKGKKTKRAIAEGAGLTVGAAGGLITGIVSYMGYEALIGMPSLKGVAQIRCLTTGENCSLAQRRYIFFEAGLLSGMLSTTVLRQLKSWYPQTAPTTRVLK